MEKLIHKASGELVSEDPFRVVGNGFKLTESGVEIEGRSGGYTYVVKEESLLDPANVAPRCVLYINAPGVSDGRRIFWRTSLYQVSS